MFAVRPLVLARMRPPVGIRTGAAALLGSRAVVTERIAFPHTGAVNINGEVWTARAYGEDEVIEPGTIVFVIEIRGLRCPGRSAAPQLAPAGTAVLTLAPL